MLFIFFVYLGSRERERERGIEKLSHPLFHSTLMPVTVWGHWCQAGTQFTPTWVSGTQLLESFLLPPRVCISRKLDSGVKARYQTPALPYGCLCLKWYLIHYWTLLCKWKKNQGRWIAWLCHFSLFLMVKSFVKEDTLSGDYWTFRPRISPNVLWRADWQGRVDKMLVLSCRDRFPSNHRKIKFCS